MVYERPLLPLLRLLLLGHRRPPLAPSPARIHRLLHLMSKWNRLRLTPGPSGWSWDWRIRRSYVERLGVHGVVRGMLRTRACVHPGLTHHDLNLTLLLCKPLDVRLEVLEALVHGREGFGVRLHVHGLNVGGSRRPCGGLVPIAEPSGLYGWQVFGKILDKWFFTVQNYVLNFSEWKSYWNKLFTNEIIENNAYLMTKNGWQVVRKSGDVNKTKN